MKPEVIDIIRLRWRRLRICRFRGSVLTDYRILRNYIKTMRKAHDAAPTP